MRGSFRALSSVAVFAVSVLMTSIASAETYDGTRIIIIDGDTIALPCDTPYRDCAEKVRLTEIDAPETFSPSCEAERTAGLVAKERLAALIRAGKVEITRSGIDRYGRTLGNVQTVAGDAGTVLLKEKLVLPYVPGRDAKLERIAYWCAPAKW